MKFHTFTFVHITLIDIKYGQQKDRIYTKNRSVAITKEQEIDLVSKG